MAQVTVFVITFNRLEYVLRTVAAIEKQTVPTRVAYIDNASSYPPLLKYLREKAAAGQEVHFMKENALFQNLTYVVNAYLDRVRREKTASGGRPQYFAITDPDVELVSDRALATYIDVFNHERRRHPHLACVGPSLMVHDIPNHYPLKDVVLQQRSVIIDRKKKHHLPHRPEVQYVNCQIDTTFAIFRTEMRHYRRPTRLPCIRVLGEFEARHLDWYVNPAKLPADQVYYNSTCKSSVVHWGGKKDAQTRAQMIRRFGLPRGRLLPERRRLLRLKAARPRR